MSLRSGVHLIEVVPCVCRRALTLITPGRRLLLHQLKLLHLTLLAVTSSIHFFNCILIYLFLQLFHYFGAKNRVAAAGLVCCFSPAVISELGRHLLGQVRALRAAVVQLMRSTREVVVAVLVVVALVVDLRLSAALHVDDGAGAGLVNQSFAFLTHHIQAHILILISRLLDLFGGLATHRRGQHVGLEAGARWLVLQGRGGLRRRCRVNRAILVHQCRLLLSLGLLVQLVYLLLGNSI